MSSNTTSHNMTWHLSPPEQMQTNITLLWSGLVAAVHAVLAKSVAAVQPGQKRLQKGQQSKHSLDDSYPDSCISILPLG